MRTGMYLRQSQDRGGAGVAVDRQRRDCLALIESRGWALTSTYVDNDFSASSGKARPGYTQLLDDLRAGLLDAVVAWHPDRLHRRPIELEAFIDVVEAQSVQVATVEAGHLDLSTPSGRMVARMLGATARFEVEHKSQRQRAAEDQRAQTGRPRRGGARPFGYTADWTSLDPVEAPLVVDAYRRVLDGDPLTAIAREWNQLGVTTTTGKSWTANLVGILLRRERNCGRLVHRGQVVGEGAWAPIVDPDTFDRLVRLVSMPGRKPVQDTSRKWLGTGLYVCGRCSTPMKSGTSGRADGRRVREYQCPGCRVTRLAEPLDGLVLLAVAKRLCMPDAAGLLAGGDSAELKASRQRVDDLSGRLDAAAADYADGVLTREQLTTITRKLRADLDTTNGALAAQLGSRDLAAFAASDSDQALAKLHAMLEERRVRDVAAVVDALLEVVVEPIGTRGHYTGLDPATVTLRWRGAPTKPRRRTVSGT